ncbi:hypothetical protein M885DRAFT_508716 [Pelagophyceae sp. CCMP2097]|nr:hypothetical protein M885DRAFT_508716 [Pelagophyceae sp. CCMP2097]
MLADLCQDAVGGAAVLARPEAMVAAAGAFVLAGCAAAVCDAAHVLCHAARHEAWAAAFDTDLVANRLGGLSFDLCCNGPGAPRSDDEARLAAKCFELGWRLRSHRASTAFTSLARLEARLDFYTASISFMLEARARPRAPRHARDGPPSHRAPSGLDCCLRVVEGLAAAAASHDDAESRTRCSRVADAARALRASGGLSDHERISCELAIAAALEPPHLEAIEDSASEQDESEDSCALDAPPNEEPDA